MFGNFTGLNPQKAVSDIEMFGSGIANVARVLEDAGVELFRVLTMSWGSPIAVEFATEYSGVLHKSLVEQLVETGDIFTNQVVNAYNTLAFPFGLGMLNPLPTIFPITMTSFGALKPQLDNGNVGIEQDTVKSALNTFLESVTAGLGLLDSLPEQVALYDQDGSIQNNYRKDVQSIRESIVSTVNDMVNKLGQDIEKEINKVTNAVSNASDALGGIASGAVAGALAGAGAAVGLPTLGLTAAGGAIVQGATDGLTGLAQSASETTAAAAGAVAGAVEAVNGNNNSYFGVADIFMPGITAGSHAINELFNGGNNN